MQNLRGTTTAASILVTLTAASASANDAKSVMQAYLDCWSTAAVSAMLASPDADREETVVKIADKSCMMKQAYAIEINDQAPVLRARAELVSHYKMQNRNQ